MAGSISVITVNYNGLELTAALIDSLHRCVRTPLEIVVVDNGSRCDEAVELQRRYPTIRAIRSEQNLGFAGGNNIGMRV
ncbi:MAG: glycosyltransferase, partial [Alistipes sp.]